MEDVTDGEEPLVDVGEVLLQFVDKHAQRPVDIHLQCIVDVLLHGVGIGIILDGAEGLVGTEQAIGAREGLDDVHILHHLVHIERVDPFRVVASQHLGDHNQQVYLL